MDRCDWFCAPGSRDFFSPEYTVSVPVFILQFQDVKSITIMLIKNHKNTCLYATPSVSKSDYEKTSIKV